ncbi:hypothetical protein M413DRAFT_445094 [Hebeloma cylindrosporum]|uniref:Uncharacterized protein n=1 Tax=Hebeloma cylindrosporum TaxID=76867 RepID=A0A0C3CE39_HEBCY|nr:hypothetical protein M413DRAFT_445094 [Hebeloma cylindrosporum h7]
MVVGGREVSTTWGEGTSLWQNYHIPGICQNTHDASKSRASRGVNIVKRPSKSYWDHH